MKIVDKIREAEAKGKPYFSIEFFPPKTEAGLENLLDRAARFAQLQPLFADITWGAGGSTADSTLEIADVFQNVIGIETQMHLTCTNMPLEKINHALKRAHASGLTNILCLRGDPPAGVDQWSAIEGGFSHAQDLVAHVRKEHGSYFGIAVAGYPEGHPDHLEMARDLKYLKEKVDAGAEVVVTQLFYDVDTFLEFVRSAREMGINVPILPGIMPIQNYASWVRMTSFCKTRVPQEIIDALEPIKQDEEAVKAYGVQLAVEQCRKMIANGILGFHFYTMNLEKSVMEILKELDMVPQTPTVRPMPWKQSAAAQRLQEEIRPIFWSNRPRSYVARTVLWDEFPNGRWGSSDSPAFGDLSEYHLGRVHSVKPHAQLLGVQSEADICQVFADYCRGSLPSLPWVDSQMQPESNVIRDQLIRLNTNGFLTTNSQPSVNGAPSADPVFGWGRPGGVVYQKAYVEFFTSRPKLEALQQALSRFPSLQLVASDAAGHKWDNMDNQRVVTAVTWGVFPGREIVQPTVVDTDAFMAWKDEAFALWLSQWQTKMPAENSAGKQAVQHVHDSYYLVSIVDNDFISGNIYAIFDAVIGA